MDVSPRSPWTHEQIQELLPKLKSNLQEMEAEDPDIRPLPPMTVAEAKDYFFRLFDVASTRSLNPSECFIMGQLLSVFEQAVRAESLGKKGRYFVISEDDINRMMGKDE